MSQNLIKKPIVLVGLMGSGKSTAGRKFAHKLGLKFYDSDKMIEENEGLSVVDIHEFKGEWYFREMESKIIKEILNYGVVVLSTGGMTFIDPELRAFIKEKAISIWLQVDPEILYERITRRDTRPEFNCENPRAVLDDMINRSNAARDQADIIVETGNVDSHYIIDSIIAKLKTFLGHEDKEPEPEPEPESKSESKSESGSESDNLSNSTEQLTEKSQS